MRKPKYRRHTTRDRGFVELDGKRHYLPGKYKSPESIAAYRAILRDRLPFVADTDSGPRKVADLAALFMRWAIATYPPGPKSETSNCRAALAHLLRIDAGTRVAQYGPLRLRALQEKLASARKSRNYVNSVCSRVRRMFRWGVSEELVPPSVYHALVTVPGLRKGRSAARETKPRQPVDWEHVRAILPELSRTVSAMVMLQWYTGARSQSICLARVEQFDTSTDPWEWRPRHKTEHHDHELILFIGPRARKLLVPLLKGRNPGGFLFQPVHSLTGKRARGYRSFYDSTSYLRAISRAIGRVNRLLPDKEKIPHWTPHQLRHSRGTEVREKFGLEAAQAFLGHSRLEATQIYAKRQQEAAKRVAIETG